MAMLRPHFMQADAGDADIEYSAQDFRISLLGSIFSAEGVLDVDAGQLQVKQRGQGPNMSVDIAAGTVVITGDDVAEQGNYLMQSTTTENRSTFSDGTDIAAPGSGSRTHRVIARVRDKMHNGIWTGYDWEIDILQDDGSGTPAVPNSAVHLAYIDISSGQSSITDGMIRNGPPRAAVGTPDRTGTFSPVAAYSASQGARLPSWHINPDGWVSLSGWIIRTFSDTEVVFNPNPLYQLFPAGSIPADVAPLGALRDIAITAAWGPIHAQVRTDGSIYWRPFVNKLLLQGDWFSLDGLGYRR